MENSCKVEIFTGDHYSVKEQFNEFLKTQNVILYNISTCGTPDNMAIVALYKDEVPCRSF